jgi:hypothetical protein
VGLALVGRGVAGPAARQRAVDEALRRLLPAAAALAAEDPWRALAAIANGAHQLAATPGARAADWSAALAALAPRAGGLDEWLRIGQVLAWRSGLAHYRESALRVADALPPALALAALGARPAGAASEGDGGGAAAASWAQLRARLARDPWHVPDEPVATGIRVVHRAGAFRGFGGLFLRPPTVEARGDQLLVRSGDEGWLLTADAFGVTFHRANPVELLTPDTVDPSSSAAARKPPPGLALGDTALTWHGRRLELPAAGAVTSVVATATTLALTTALSHAVILVALGEDA